MSNSDYGGEQQQTPTIKLQPQAIIHLPENVYSHKITDTIKLDHEQLSNYLSSINYLPDTIHKHAQILAQLDPADIHKYGQSINSNQLPLISLTVPESNNAQMKIEEYSPPAAQQQYGSQQNSGYQQQDYNQGSAQQSGYGQQEQQSYSPPQAPRKNCHKNSANSGNSGNYGSNENNSQEYGNNAGTGYSEGGSAENTGDYNDNKQPEVNYQSNPQMDNNNYDAGNNYQPENNNQGGGYENNQGGGQQDNGYSNNNNQQDYDKSSDQNDYGSNESYESSPFDYNFVQEILRSVMNQLEQLQLNPDNLSVYGKTEDSNQGEGDNYNNNGGESDYGNSNQLSGYEVQGGRQGIQLIDRPEGNEVNYGYSINHGSYESQPQHNEASNNNYEPNGYVSSSTTSQATSYGSEPNVVLDNKIPINENRQHHSTVTYRMPQISLELPKKQIEHIMKAISGKKGRYSQPIMIKANSLKLPSNLNLGKIKTVFIKSSTLNNLDLPLYLNNMNNINNDYKEVPSMSKNEETKYDSNPVLSAYNYGVNPKSSKLYASASSKKSAFILPIKSRSKKRLGHNTYSSLQAASSNIKSIISTLPKISKSKKVISAKQSSPLVTPTVVEKKK